MFEPVQSFTEIIHFPFQAFDSGIALVELQLQRLGGAQSNASHV